MLKDNDGSYEIEMTIKAGNAEIFGFSLNNSKNETLNFNFDNTTGFLSIDRKKSGLTEFNDRFAMGMNAPLAKKDVYRIFVCWWTKLLPNYLSTRAKLP